MRLNPEITRDDVTAIAGWLQDESVRRYLSDSEQAAAGLGQLLERVGLATLTHLFSQSGRFLMICDHRDRPIGYVRLIQGKWETELVIVIGDRACWGRHYARQAVRDSLRIAFFEMRSERVVARIHCENAGSRRIFSHLGFRTERVIDGLVRMTMTMDDYLRLTSEQPARGSEIVVTAFDRERLLRWLNRPLGDRAATGAAGVAGDVRPQSILAGTGGVRPGVERTRHVLAEEIDRAVIVDSRELPQNVITMNSQATLSIDDKELTLSLAFPDDADWSQKRISILSPIGTAILGFSAGDRFNWRFQAGLANIQVHNLHYQPEAAGDYHL